MEWWEIEEIRSYDVRYVHVWAGLIYRSISIVQAELSLDSFTVPLHSPNSRRLPLGLFKGTVIGLWKMVEISTGDLSPQSIVTEVIPIYI